MSKKINVKTMDFGMLSNYNVASANILEINARAKEELEPLRNEKKEILAKREEEIKNMATTGKTLDQILSENSVDKVDMQINAINERVKEEMKPEIKAQNKILKNINENVYYAYIVSMSNGENFKVTGEYSYINSKDETVKISINNKNHFYACIKELFGYLGATHLEDEKAMNSAVSLVAKQCAGMIWKSSTQKNEFKTKSQVVHGIICAIISYCVSRGVCVVNDDNTITKVERVAE